MGARRGAKAASMIENRSHGGGLPLGRAWLVAAGLLALPVAFGLDLGAAAPAVGLGPLTKVSVGNPFAGCTADGIGGKAGAYYPNSEVEPWIAADPANPDRLLAGWQQDRRADSGSRGVAVAVSVDGGTTWGERVPRKITLCAGGPRERASDVWVEFGPTGTAFLLDLVF